MRTVLLMQCLTEIDDIKDQRRVAVSDKCMREVAKVSENTLTFHTTKTGTVHFLLDLGKNPPSTIKLEIIDQF